MQANIPKNLPDKTRTQHQLTMYTCMQTSIQIWSLHVDSGTGHDDDCSSTSTYSPANYTLSTLSRLGPEDPRIALVPPSSHAKLNHPQLTVTFNRVPQEEECEKQSRMFVANVMLDGGTFDEEDSDMWTDAHPLVYAESKDDVKEKNWMSIGGTQGSSAR
jgi:hypothetical protein